MSMISAAAKPAPSHVPARLVVDFDVYRPMKPGDAYHDPFARLLAEGAPPLFWSPYNEGHWVAARRDILSEVFANPELFTSSQGAAVPKEPDRVTRLVPIESDPPIQQAYRALFARAFTAPALRAREEEVRSLAVSLIEGFRANGRCEFVRDLAHHLPIKIFMGMAGLPEEDRLSLLPLAGAMVEAEADKKATLGEIMRYIAGKLQERVAEPRDDLLTAIANGAVEGRPITQHEAMGVGSLLLIGGLDTVASMMGHMMHFLARRPEHRARLTADPGLIPGAVEEFLRRFAITNPARTVTRDTEFHGVKLKAGDMIMLSTPFGAIDGEAYADALEVEFERKSPGKTTFGAGPHVCPGAMLARMELRVLLEEWLPRIPDFSLDPDDHAVVRTGVNGSMVHLPLVWPAG